MAAGEVLSRIANYPANREREMRVKVPDSHEKT